MCQKKCMNIRGICASTCVYLINLFNVKTLAFFIICKATSRHRTTGEKTKAPARVNWKNLVSLDFRQQFLISHSLVLAQADLHENKMKFQFLIGLSDTIRTIFICKQLKVKWSQSMDMCHEWNGSRWQNVSSVILNYRMENLLSLLLNDEKVKNKCNVSHSFWFFVFPSDYSRLSSWRSLLSRVAFALWWRSLTSPALFSPFFLSTCRVRVNLYVYVCARWRTCLPLTIFISKMCIGAV